MALGNRIGMPLLLLALFIVGIGLIWHIGHNFGPTGPAGPSNQAFKQVTAPPAAPSTSSSSQTPAGPAVEENSAAREVRSSKPAATLPQNEPSKAGRQIPGSSENTQAAQAKGALQSKAGEPRSAKTAASKTNLPATLEDLRNRTKNPRLRLSEKGMFLTTEPILFNTGLAKIRSASLSALDALAALLKEKPDIVLEIVGHTDNLGVEATNRKISADRAASRSASKTS